jgi:hypothetical protein
MNNRALRPGLEPLEGKSLLSVTGGAVLATPVVQSPPPASPTSVAVSLTTNRRVYQPGQPVTIMLTATNTTNHPVAFNVGPSINGFSVTQNNVTVWRSNSGIQPMFVQLRTIPAHGSITLTSTWNGQSNQAPLMHRTGLFTIHSQIPHVRTAMIRIMARHG